MTRPTVAVLMLVVLAAFSASGCASQKELLASKDVELDSMYTANRELQDQMQVLRDSLRFLDDIDSGQYYRDRRTLTDEIGRLEYELAVCTDGGQTIETLLVDDLFEPASAQLTEAGRTRLAVLADTLTAAYADQQIRVEGHGDAMPIGASLLDVFPTNWELAAGRAAAVARYLLDERGFDPAQIEVVSFGSAQPVAPNSTADGRKRNRRIRIAAMPLL